MWISGSYHFPSTFSYKIPDFSMYYAASTPIPGPSTFKLAMISAFISSNRDLEKASALFEGIKTSTVLFDLPNRLTVYKAFIKRLKKKRLEPGFDKSFGIREYVIFDGILTIYIDISDETADYALPAMKNIRYLGSSDSICYCLEVNEKVEKPDFKRLARPHFEEKTNGIIFQLKDFTKETTFEKINRYGHEKLVPERDVKIIPYILPLKVDRRGKNFITYKTLKIE